MHEHEHLCVRMCACAYLCFYLCLFVCVHAQLRECLQVCACVCLCKSVPKPLLLVAVKTVCLFRECYRRHTPIMRTLWSLQVYLCFICSLLLSEVVSSCLFSPWAASLHTSQPHHAMPCHPLSCLHPPLLRCQNSARQAQQGRAHFLVCAAAS